MCFRIFEIRAIVLQVVAYEENYAAAQFARYSRPTYQHDFPRMRLEAVVFDPWLCIREEERTTAHMYAKWVPS
jgi:hypothetical protein